MDKIQNRFQNNKLKKVVNVYKSNYNGLKPNGLGDYLRGCFFLMQLSKLLNVEFEIDISQHPISKFVQNPKSVNELNYDNIGYFNLDFLNNNNFDDENNKSRININEDVLNRFIDYLNTQDCEVFGLYSISYPCFNIHNEEGTNFIKSRLEPSQDMNNYIDETLNSLGLSKKGYGIIHIRIGDQYINNEAVNMSMINSIYKTIKKTTFRNKKYLIISDSNYLKSFLKKVPNFYIYIKNIEHLGTGSDNEECIKNTMLDFYLMGYSNSILSLSIYEHNRHVSGFSKYCAVINNIPFYKMKIR